MQRIDAQNRLKSTGTPETRKYRVLVVDDESDIAFTFKEGLERSGFRVDSFNEP